MLRVRRPAVCLDLGQKVIEGGIVLPHPGKLDPWVVTDSGERPFDLYGGNLDPRMGIGDRGMDVIQSLLLRISSAVGEV
jgi:hypothetical protein